ncbi:motility associated factor glycosyltransferase family protein [Alkaliphilus peptidifermentans]|uniref:Uncharacterized conserved protein n=1 Tax=Alkaliphilus peptidifermentans DSM 18978 TaxID=1120976 RepID=A0A1G5JFV1_9FIRM|nr:6-hydroxymethylpterin diphosphokinase MptE-like protein [Alkaliphilus peptidifermentans]SCY86791.1 Uncharacterized conserved protein [Alkaliphilus peptidifermentans DSM 18978]
MLINNIKLISNFFKTEFKIKEPVNSNIRIELTKSNDKTIIVKSEENQSFLHSKYDPVNEAQTIINQYSDKLTKDSHVIFYGLGLGYHIEYFLQNYSNISFSIYEPNPDIFYHYLSNFNISNLINKNFKRLAIEESHEHMVSFIDAIISELDKNIVIIELPSYKRVFKDEYENFANLFNKKIKYKRNGIHTNAAFQKLWIINSMINFPHVLNTPNILLESEDNFKGKTALLVAAGPSLNDEIENIRYIKANKLAYIFSVGSAINTLIHHEIAPDFSCTYDPGTSNKKVFEKVVEKGISDIPLIFGSSVGFETIKDYPGPMYHFITNQDTVASYFLALRDNDGKEIDLIEDAASIAIITLQLLYKLGFSKVVLVGQNLAYRNDAYYSDAVSYGESMNLSEKNQKDAFTVKDVYGNDVYTYSAFYAMKIELEKYIKRYQDQIEVINTTKGGADIKGTTFIPLENHIETDLKNSIDIMSTLTKKHNYDLDIIKNKLMILREDFNKVNSLVFQLQNIVEKISKLTTDNNLKQIENMYVKLDEKFYALKENKFFLHYILPMNRLNFELAVKEISGIRYDNNRINKAQKIVKNYNNLIGLFKQDIKLVDPIFAEMVICIDENIKELNTGEK